MRRRALLAGAGAALGLAAWARTSPAQQPKVWRIGVLETIPADRNRANLDRFLAGLRELGYVEGRNVVVEYRSADGSQERFAPLVGELLRMHPDVIVTRGTPAVLAAKAATTTIPIVMTSAGDPVGSKIVASLARPGGNVTGLSAFNVELYAKRVELMRELVPKVERIAGLFNMGNPVNALQWQQLQEGARTLGVRLQLLDVRKAEQLARAFDDARAQRAQGIVVALDSLTQSQRLPIVELAARYRLPAIYGAPEFADDGGLVAYSASYADLYYRAATYVDKIFKGAKPGDLPVEQATQFELVVNRRAARTLGLAIPQSVLVRADRIIE